MGRPHYWKGEHSNYVALGVPLAPLPRQYLASTLLSLIDEEVPCGSSGAYALSS